MMQSPFTIISSNPTYMSYRDTPPTSNDMSMFSPLSSNDNQSYSMDAQSFSFFPQQQSQQQNYLSPDILMKDYSTQADAGTFTFSPMSAGRELSALDELFGGQANTSPAFSPYSTGASPVSHASASKPSPQVVTDCPTGTTSNCSKEMIAGLIAAKGPSTFVTSDRTQEIFGEGSMTFDGIQLQPTEANDSNIDACAAFQSLKSRPEFKVRPFVGPYSPSSLWLPIQLWRENAHRFPCIGPCELVSS
jgi:AP-1-like factor